MEIMSVFVSKTVDLKMDMNLCYVFRSQRWTGC